MSAINDALRRASTAAKTGPGANPAPPPSLADLPTPPPLAIGAPPPSPGSAALPPIITAPPGLASSPNAEKKRSKAPLVLSLILLFCLLGAGAAYFLGKRYLVAQAREKRQKGEEEFGTNNARLAALFADPKAVVHAPTNNVATNSVPVRPQVPVSRGPDVTPKAAAVVITPAPAPVVAPRAAVPFPPLRLQSIFYRTTNACVMINGKTLFVDDQINGVTVADIQPASVTMVLSGQTNILTLR
jgi:hypothetical protein